jgi:hypothetical protein
MGILPISGRETQDIPATEAAAILSLYLHQRNLPRFFPILQQGYQVKVLRGASIRTILCRDLGLGSEHLEGRIRTVFLNGKPVDDVDTALVSAGDTLALSAATPNMGWVPFHWKGDCSASLPAGCNQLGEEQVTPKSECLVRLKLFNLLLEELGPFFLEKGILIKGAVLEEFLHHQPEDFWSGCLAVSLDGQEMDLQTLATMAWPKEEDPVCLRVVFNLETRSSR